MPMAIGALLLVGIWIRLMLPMVLAVLAVLLVFLVFLLAVRLMLLILLLAMLLVLLPVQQYDVIVPHHQALNIVPAGTLAPERHLGSRSAPSTLTSKSVSGSI